MTKIFYDYRYQVLDANSKVLEFRTFECRNVVPRSEEESKLIHSTGTVRPKDRTIEYDVDFQRTQDRGIEMFSQARAHLEVKG